MNQSQSVDLNKIPVKFINRQRMKMHGVWRCTVGLPSLDKYENLAPVLSGMIDRFVNVTIEGSVKVKIHPAQIIDVPSKGKKFFLVIEANAAQDSIGPYITALTGEDVCLSIIPCDHHPGKPEKEIAPGDVSAESLKGLHIFFQNPKFQEFVDKLTGKTVKDKDTCKAMFKEYMEVDSCRELSDSSVSGFIKEFNAWLNG